MWGGRIHGIATSRSCQGESAVKRSESRQHYTRRPRRWVVTKCYAHRRALNGAGSRAQTPPSCRQHASRLSPRSAALSSLAASESGCRTRIAPSRAGWRRPQGRTLGSMSMVDVAPDGTLWIAERCGANDCLANGDVDPILHVGAERRVARRVRRRPVRVAARHLRRRRRQRLGHRRARRRRPRPSSHQVRAGRPRAAAARHVGARRRRADALQRPDRRRRRAERRRVRQRRPRADVEQPHREVRGRRPYHQGMGRHAAARRASSSCRTRSRSIRKAGCSSPIATTTASRSSIRTATSWTQWTQFGRPSGIHIAADDTLYVSDNQSNDERHPRLAARHLRRQREGRLGAARSFRTPSSTPARAQETGAHGLAADAAGTIYGAEVYSQSVKKYVR